MCDKFHTWELFLKCKAGPPLHCVNPFRSPSTWHHILIFSFAFCLLPCPRSNLQEASAPWYALSTVCLPRKLLLSLQSHLLCEAFLDYPQTQAFFLSFVFLWCFVYPSLPAGLSTRVRTLSRQGLGFILVCAKPRVWHQLDFQYKVVARQWSIMVH